MSDYNITEKIKTDNTFSFAQQLCVCKLDKMKKYQNREIIIRIEIEKLKNVIQTILSGNANLFLKE